MLFATCAVVCRAAVPVDFERDVRPLLSDRCYSCHGPDEATRKVGLRLDTEEGAKKARGPHTPVVPGNPAASEILRRVAPAQPAMRMPPPYSDRKPLTEAEVAMLRAWIEQGAKWQAALVVRTAEAARAARGARHGLGAQPDRPFHPGAPGAGRPHALSRGRSRPPLAPRELRPHRPAADPRRTRRLPRRPLAGCL